MIRGNLALLGSVILGAVAPLLIVSSGAAIPPPPPPEGWSAAEWNALPRYKQDQELQAYPSAAGSDPQAKAAWLATNPPLEPSIAADAASDGPGSPYSTGVAEWTDSPLAHSIYRITNSWGALSSSGKNFIRVYAGERADQTAQSGAPMGFIDVREVPYPHGSSVTDNEYHYPCGSGPLSISSGTLSQIVLNDARGATITFDLGTRAFTPACRVQ